MFIGLIPPRKSQITKNWNWKLFFDKSCSIMKIKQYANMPQKNKARFNEKKKSLLCLMSLKKRSLEWKIMWRRKPSRLDEFCVSSVGMAIIESLYLFFSTRKNLSLLFRPWSLKFEQEVLEGIGKRIRKGLKIVFSGSLRISK